MLAREGPITIERTHSGGCYAKRTEANEILQGILRDLDQTKTDLVVSSANGTFIDQAELNALEHGIPDAIVYTGKPAIGESVGASALWQVIFGAQALRKKELPPVLHADGAISLKLSRSRMPLTEARHAIILASGVNQQIAALRLAVA